MYRALYAHNNKLSKYLSFQPGDRFTLVDTSVSDQWFLAQNGLGEIGYVPFNYIKKVEATVEQQIKFIDGAIEAIHLQATGEQEGQYTNEQRIIMKKLVKHRSEVIKSSRGSDVRSSGRRRPAPAPPVEARASSIERTEVESSHNKSQSQNSQVKAGKSSGHSRTNSAHTEVVVEKTASHQDADSVRKSKSVTSSMGHAPSLISSYSSNSSEVTDASDSKASNGSNPFEDDDEHAEQDHSVTRHEQGEVTNDSVPKHDTTLTDNGKVEDAHVDYDSAKNPFADDDLEEENHSVQSLSSNPVSYQGHPCEKQVNSNKHTDGQIYSQEESQSDKCKIEKGETNVVPQTLPNSTKTLDETDLSSEKSQGEAADFPPPPPEVYDDINMEQFDNEDLDLPPAPPDLVPPGEIEEDQLLKGDNTYVNLNSDILELCGHPSIDECVCDNFQPKLDVRDAFFADGALDLPADRRVGVTKKDEQVTKEASRVFNSLLKCQGGGKSSPSGVPTPQRMLELAQAHCVAVTHGDCEEMIGEFRKVTRLSHEESHWALISAMSLLASKVPHIKPSLEAVGLRFNMAHECHSTGTDFQSEDAQLLDSLTSELSDVTHDAQQRGHYLRDDLDHIIDIVTNLTETLNSAKHCVSVAAIQKDNYNLVELIAKYYQMETRWVIHSCLLQLIETVCCLNSHAIHEFLYSELPQEMVSEMQQHHNDDNRLLQVAKTLGIIFMKGLPSPHKLSYVMDVHFFIWLLGVSENLSELNRPGDVDILLALVCAWLLQYADDTGSGSVASASVMTGSMGSGSVGGGNPLMDAFKMAQGHALLSQALRYLSKHDDPTLLFESVVRPSVNTVVLLLTHLFDSPDTADLLYSNDVDALIGIFEEYLRDLAPDDPLRLPTLRLMENFLRCYPDTAALRSVLSSRLGPLLVNIRQEGVTSSSYCLATRILEDNSTVFDDI